MSGFQMCVFELLVLKSNYILYRFKIIGVAIFKAEFSKSVYKKTRLLAGSKYGFDDPNASTICSRNRLIFQELVQ